ncbi:hypothetical protein RND71_003906 [Anisodus tanguticus]|uniref:Uncharacterized protein n=1 Tax=Anisodus tanguticus TaxID=243964 RepID=A0AAE1SWN4_9SOLA|nr:hypothetical protein RND71_003906 [Anisodus tanguticus]
MKMSHKSEAILTQQHFNIPKSSIKSISRKDKVHSHTRSIQFSLHTRSCELHAAHKEKYVHLTHHVAHGLPIFARKAYKCQAQDHVITWSTCN